MLQRFDISTIIESLEMDVEATVAIKSLAALAQEHRLAAFKALVQAGAGGMAAGALAGQLDLPNSSLSFHLAQLSNAGLISQRRAGRSLIYSANYPAMNDLVDYLTENCCGGASCAPGNECAPESVNERKVA